MMIPDTIVGGPLNVSNDESLQFFFDNANAGSALLKLRSSNLPGGVASPKLNDCATSHSARQKKMISKFQGVLAWVFHQRRKQITMGSNNLSSA
jgi:hypothetical protein